MYDPWARTKEGTAGEKGDTGWGGQRGKNWDNCNSLTNKIYLKKREMLIEHLLLVKHIAGY